MKSQDLLNELTKITESHLNRAKELLEIDFEKLNWKENQLSWSVLECLEHLNLYGDFYLPEIKSKITYNKSNPVLNFKSGWLGDYFANSMLPKEKLNKMKTFADKNPNKSKLNKATIERFIQQQNELLILLKKAEKVNLNKVKTKLTIPILTLKLGDTFRFIINHNIRHFQQLEKVLKLQG